MKILALCLLATSLMAHETRDTTTRLVIGFNDGLLDLSFRAEARWRLEYSEDMRRWNPFVQGVAGDHRVGIPCKCAQQGFFRLLVEESPACDRDDDDDDGERDQGREKHKKPKDKHHH